MSDNKLFQSNVNNLIGSNGNFQLDRAHAGKPKHADLTQRLDIKGADKVEVDFNGNIIGGSTFIGKTKMDW